MRLQTGLSLQSALLDCHGTDSYTVRPLDALLIKA